MLSVVLRQALVRDVLRQCHPNGQRKDLKEELQGRQISVIGYLESCIEHGRRKMDVTALKVELMNEAAGFLEQYRDARNWSGAGWGSVQISQVVQTARHCIYEQMKDVRARQLERERDEARSQMAALRQDVATLREQVEILQAIICRRPGGADQLSLLQQQVQEVPPPAQPVESEPLLVPVPRPELPYSLRVQVPGIPQWWEYNGLATERGRDNAKKALFLGLLGETGYSSRKVWPWGRSAG